MQQASYWLFVWPFQALFYDRLMAFSDFLFFRGLEVLLLYGCTESLSSQFGMIAMVTIEWS